MLLDRAQKEELNIFLNTIRLKNSGIDRSCKINQILAYLEVIHSLIRKLSYKRELVFIDSGAGNCYLSFLVYYYYTKIDKRKITIHCIDMNEKLMVSCRERAEKNNFKNMFFHSSLISEFQYNYQPDIVYSLHACDTATDQALYLGLRLKSRNILSVSCCQHTVKKSLRNIPYKGISRHNVFKDRIIYMLADSMRALLLESCGYKTDIIEFVSSRYTDKNVMIRAKMSGVRSRDTVLEEYRDIKRSFSAAPVLENYLNENAS